MAVPATAGNECRMVKDGDAERTELASEKRLRQAREDGDISRSRDVADFTVREHGLSLDRGQVYNPDVLIDRIAATSVACNWPACPRRFV